MASELRRRPNHQGQSREPEGCDAAATSLMAPPAAPLRWIDRFLLLFFYTAALVVVFIDSEQILLKDPTTYTKHPTSWFGTCGDDGWPVLWPPSPFIDLIHWWGNQYDPLLIKRPIWFKTAIFLDLTVQLPSLLLAIVAFHKRSEDMLRTPGLIYATLSITIMASLMAEQFFGEFAGPSLVMTLAAYGLWCVGPVALLARLLTSPPGRFFLEKENGEM